MGTFLFFSVVAVLTVASALFFGLSLGFLRLNHYELKRRAQAGDKAAKTVYPLRALGRQLLVTLFIGNVLVNSTIVAMLGTRFNVVVAVFLTTAIVVLFGQILSLVYVSKYTVETAAATAPAIRLIVRVLAPVAKPLGNLLNSWLGEETATIASKEELFKILAEHRIAPNSDITREELSIVRHALSFSAKQVREVMTPRRVVTSVAAADDVGPVLIDELYKSGHSRFPVHEGKKPEKFVGTLYLHDIVGIKTHSKAEDLMRKKVFYIHEEQTLDNALGAFLKTNHHLLVVVNTFEEFVGVLSMEDVIEQIIGKQIIDEFDAHADLRAVAKSLAEREAARREKNEAR